MVTRFSTSSFQVASLIFMFLTSISRNTQMLAQRNANPPCWGMDFRVHTFFSLSSASVSVRTSLARCTGPRSLPRLFHRSKVRFNQASTSKPASTCSNLSSVSYWAPDFICASFNTTATPSTVSFANGITTWRPATTLASCRTSFPLPQRTSRRSVPWTFSPHSDSLSSAPTSRLLPWSLTVSLPSCPATCPWLDQPLRPSSHPWSSISTVALLPCRHLFCPALL